MPLSESEPPRESNAFVLTGTDAGILQAHNAKDGSLRWQRQMGHPFGGSGLAQVGETIIAASRDGYIYALDADNAAVHWETALPRINQTFEGTQIRIAAASSGIALQYGKRIIVLDPADGTLLWDYILPPTTYQGWMAAVGVSHVYIVEQQFTAPITWMTLARAISDGTVQWATSEYVTLEPIWDVGSSLVEKDDVVYAYGFGLHALDSQTGSLLWEQKALPEFHVAQIIVGRTVVVVSLGNYLGAFRRETGVQLWSMTGRHGEQGYFEEFSCVMVLENNGEEVICVGRREANPPGFLLEARAAETGSLHWSWRGSSSSLEPTWRFRESGGVIYVPTDNGVYAVRAIDGQEIWQLPLADASLHAFLAISLGTT